MAARKTSTKVKSGPSPQVHSFTMVLSGADEATLEIADALYEAGCDDATVYSRDGVLYAAFDREAPTPVEAIGSALRDVESTGLLVTRIDPDDSPLSAARPAGAARRHAAVLALLDLINAALRFRRTPGGPGAAGVDDVMFRGPTEQATFRILFGPAPVEQPGKSDPGRRR